jgi:general secretion pathway protein F
MPSYKYRASTREGKIIEGTMDAVDNSVVAQKIQEMGFLPVHIGTANRKSFFTADIQWRRNTKKVRRKDLLVFTQELHTLTKAGFPLDRSLAILVQLAESPAMGAVIQDVLKEVKGGKSFSEALNKHPEVFPKIYMSMIKAGEAGGALEEILHRLADYLTTAGELKSYIVGAMIYPALLSLVGILSMLILMFFVVPQFTAMFEEQKIPLPLAMAVINFFSQILTKFWWLLLILIALVGSYIRNFRNSDQGRLKSDRWLLRIPLVGAVLRKVEVARFSRCLGTLLHGGVPLLQGMTIVRDIIANQSIATTIDPIRNGIKKGEGIARPIKQSGVFPPLAMHLIEVGEESGKLDSMLVQVADVYEVEVRNGIKNLIAFFEPAMILVMGLLIGTLIVSMLVAVFSMNDIPM